MHEYLPDLGRIGEQQLDWDETLHRRSGNGLEHQFDQRGDYLWHYTAPVARVGRSSRIGKPDLIYYTPLTGMETMQFDSRSSLHTAPPNRITASCQTSKRLLLPLSLLLLLLQFNDRYDSAENDGEDAKKQVGPMQDPPGVEVGHAGHDAVAPPPKVLGLHRRPLGAPNR